jgi:peptidyl-tRNA hydrolase
MERGFMRIKVLGRKNLKMTSGKLAAQSVHAALNLYKKDPQDHWSCVVLEVSDKKFEEAKEAHPGAYVVHDAGYTEVQAGTQTCLAFYEEDPREQEMKLVEVELLLDKKQKDWHELLSPAAKAEVLANILHRIKDDITLPSSLTKIVNKTMFSCSINLTELTTKDIKNIHKFLNTLKDNQ